MLSRLGIELRSQDGPPRPVTRPPLEFMEKGPPTDDEPERREIAAKFLEARIIKDGASCWQAIGRAESFEAWVKIGKALQIGRDYALKTTGANRPMGQIYCRTFSAWIDQHGFERMPAATRSVAVELAENIETIEAWRNTLPERQRKRLVHPLSVTRRWKASTAHNGKSPTDLRRDARQAWARFCACARALPPSEARTLWRAVAAEATAHL
jgi:hypothetical protein